VTSIAIQLDRKFSLTSDRLGVGGLIGAALAGPATRAFGLGPSIIGSLGLWAVGYGGLALVPETPAAPLVAAILLAALGAINPLRV